MKSLILFTFLISSYSLFSQHFTIINGEEFEPQSKTGFLNISTSDTSAVYIRRKNTAGTTLGFLIEKIDIKTQKSLFIADLEIEESYKLAEIQIISNKILVFFTKIDKKEKYKYLLLKEISAINGEKISDTKIVSSLNYEDSGYERTNFFVKFSPDKSKMIIISSKNNRTASTIECNIYDTNNFKKLASKDLKESQMSIYLDFDKFKVDNAGNIFYLFKYYDNFIDRNIGIGITTLLLNFPKGQTILLPLNKVKVQFEQTNFEFDNNLIYISGAFNDSLSGKEVTKSGYFLFTVDIKSNEIKSKSFNYLPNNIKEKLAYKVGTLKLVTLKNIIRHNNCTYVIGYHAYSIMSDERYYFANEILISKFDKDNKLEWMRLIPKFSEYHLTDYNYLIKDNKIHFIFAENKKNIENYDLVNYDIKKIKRTDKVHGSVVIAVSVNEKGDLVRNELFENSTWCYENDPVNYISNNGKSLLIRMSKGKKERYDKVTVQ